MLNQEYSPVYIVGILNVTPDSYHDGGRYEKLDAAVAHAGAMLREGVDLIEVGGESTGPGSLDVTPEEELHRIVGILEAITCAYPNARLAIDTYHAATAKRAIDLGVTMVNDVTAGRGDSDMFATIAAAPGHVQYVMMHAKDETARTTIAAVQYDDVVAHIIAFLHERKEAAVVAGIVPERIVLDPGLGHFVSSDPTYSFQIIEELRRFEELECPLFVSPSRKSFLAGPKNLPPSERLEATVEASVRTAQNGAMFIRTHDVREVREALFVQTPTTSHQ